MTGCRLSWAGEWVVTIFDVSNPPRGRSKPRLAEHDAEEARVSDYLLLFGIGAIFFLPITFGVLKLLGIL